MFDNPKNVFFVHSLDEPLHDDCRREVATYDNGEPVYWVDIPFGTRSWEPMYLCTEAARIYMMSDAEFEEYEKEQLAKKVDDVSDEVFAKHLTWFVLIGLMLSALVCVSFFFAIWLSLILLVVDLSYIGIFSFLLYHRMKRPLPIGIESGSDEERIFEQLENFDGESVLKGYATDCAKQVKQLSAEIEQVNVLLDDLFTVGSLTWHRYYDTLAVARDHVVTNADILLQAINYARGSDDLSVEHSCMVKASTVLHDNRKVLKSVEDLHEDMKAFSFNERVLGSSSDVTDLVAEVETLSDDLALYKVG